MVAALRIKNKYRHRERKRRRLLSGIVRRAFSFCVIFGSATYILFFSPLLKINEVTVECSLPSNAKCAILKDSKEIKGPIEDIIKGKYFWFIERNNFLFLRKKDIQAVILNKNPKIESLTIQKNFLDNIVKIGFAPRKPSAIFCKVSYLNSKTDVDAEFFPAEEPDVISKKSENGPKEREEEILPKSENCFYVDKKGVVFERAPNAIGSLILVIKQEGLGEVELGGEIIEPKLLDFFQNLQNDFKIRAGISFFELNIVSDSIFTYIKGKTSEGWEIYVMPGDDTENLVEILNAVFTQEIRDKRRNLQYVDLRLKNKIYYKLNEEGEK